MLYQEAEFVCAPVYLNALPKSGLHALELMAQKVVKPSTAWGNQGTWITTLQDRSFSLEESDKLRRNLGGIARIPLTHYGKGHAPYTIKLERLHEVAGHAVILIIRDLRDVAVSQSFHMHSRNVHRYPFPGKEHWQMQTGPDILEAVIRGQGWMPSLADRWDAFTPWLECECVHVVRFERLVTDPVNVAEEVFRFVMGRTADTLQVNFKLDGEKMQQLIKEMAEAVYRTDRSPTFRKGVPGEWRERFEDRHYEAVEETGLMEYNIELGYPRE